MIHTEPRRHRWTGRLRLYGTGATLALLLCSLDAAAQLANDVRVLISGATQERELSSDETHSYTIALASDQYAHVVVEQPGVNVGVKLFAPDGQLLTEANSWPKGYDESISIVAEVAGEHRIEISRIEKDAVAGLYRVGLEELREAGTQDRSRVAAEKAFAEGQLLREVGTADSRREAIGKYELSLPLWRAAGNVRGEAWALTALSAVHHQLGENRKALAYGEQALPLSREAGDRRGEAHALNRIGLAWWSLNEYEKALDHFTQALPLYRAEGRREDEATTLHNMGIIHSSLGEYPLAMEHYTTALTISRELGNTAGEAVTLNNMGVVLQSMGESQNALEAYDRALPLRRATGNRRGEAYTLANIGDVYSALGESGKALEYYRQALLLGRAVGDRRIEAVLLGSVGKMNAALGHPERAREHYAQALALYREQDEQRGEANTLSDIGWAHHKAREFRKALELHNSALTIRRTIGDRGGEAHSLSHLGRAFSELGDHQNALQHFSEALTLQRAVHDRKGEAFTLFGIARVHRTLGELADARSHMESAIEIIESLRTRVTSHELRASFLASVSDFYVFYTDLLMELHEKEPSAGHNVAALTVSERSRARSLLDTLAEARVDIRHGVDAELLERERNSRLRVNSRANRLARLASGVHTEEQAAAARMELESLLTEFQEVRSQIRARSPAYAALTQPAPLSVREIQKRVLDPKSLLLEYSLGEERSFLWAVTTDSFTSHILPGRGALETAARRVYELLTARNQNAQGETPKQRAVRVRETEAEYSEAAAILSEMLLGPVAAELGTRRLIIVAEGALQYVPFGSLPAPHEEAPQDGPPRERGAVVPMIAHHEIVTLPSASVLDVLRSERKGRASAAKAVAVLADPVFRSDDPRVVEADENEMVAPSGDAIDRSPAQVEQSAKESGVTAFRRLRFSRQEADAITALIPGSKTLTAIDFAASRDTAISRELGEYRVVHFATHGLLNSRHPELSGIVLSLVDENGKPRDGFLRLHEIYNLELGADLVVLSACQTALGKEIRGEGLVGLTRGFMYAGAPRVVASLWNVDDRATAELMKRFYAAMFTDGMRPAAALRTAQQSLRREKGWESPYYWAGFTLQGEWK